MCTEKSKMCTIHFTVIFIYCGDLELNLQYLQGLPAVFLREYVCLYSGMLSIYDLFFSLRKASWGFVHTESHLHLPPGLFEAEPSTSETKLH